MEPDYIGIEGHYGNDIAIMVLKVNVIISKFIKPICIDWTNKFNISNGSVGKVN